MVLKLSLLLCDLAESVNVHAEKHAIHALQCPVNHVSQSKPLLVLFLAIGSLGKSLCPRVICTACTLILQQPQCWSIIQLSKGWTNQHCRSGELCSACWDPWGVPNPCCQAVHAGWTCMQAQVGCSPRLSIPCLIPRSLILSGSS